MGIGKRIKEARERACLTQEELGKMIGVTGSAITNYEKETSHPKEPVMYALIDALGVDANFLFQDCVKTKTASSISDEAMGIAKRYDGLDEHGKEMVSLALDCEAKRMDKQKDQPEKVIELFPTRKYLQSATAGSGDFNDDASYEMVDLVKRPPVGTSFIVTASGDSMEPTYHDGDQLFVRAQERVELGDIGLFTQGPKLYIKESGSDGLISHNEAYDIITGTEDEPIRAQGKIIGICSEEYLR